MIQFIIPAALAFIVGLSLWAIKRERYSLGYAIVESDLFPREGGSGKYFVCALRNNGNRAVENISIKMDISHGVIDSVEYSNSRLLNVSEQAISVIRGIVPLLNPKEEIGAIITIKDANEESALNVEARAIGVTAVKRNAESMPEYLKTLLVPVIAIGIVVTFVSLWSTYTQSRVTQSLEKIGDFKALSTDLDKRAKNLEELKREAEERHRKEEQGEPRKEQIIFSTLNRAGLSHVLPSLINVSGEGLPFWKTGLHLMHSYLLDKKNARKYIHALEQLSNIDFIAPSSKGFLLYLAGKIEKAEGNTDAAIKYYEMCKKAAPLMHDYLMAQDPAYDLNAIKKWLSKNIQK